MFHWPLLSSLLNMSWQFLALHGFGWHENIKVNGHQEVKENINLQFLFCFFVLSIIWLSYLLPCAIFFPSKSKSERIRTLYIFTLCLVFEFILNSTVFYNWFFYLFSKNKKIKEKRRRRSFWIEKRKSSEQKINKKDSQVEASKSTTALKNSNISHNLLRIRMREISFAME